MEYPSKTIEKAIEEIAKLPGIGKKTALRLALHLLRESKGYTQSLSDALVNLREHTLYCEKCMNISDEKVCRICQSHNRDSSIICVVEDTRDVIAIENTSQFSGLYHVLGGVISPIDGIGPEDLNIQQLKNRIEQNTDSIKEVLFALNSTMEGDTTTFYLTKILKQFDIHISSIARGVPIGGELEYADEITLGRSIVNRIVYKRE